MASSCSLRQLGAIAALIPAFCWGAPSTQPSAAGDHGSDRAIYQKLLHLRSDFIQQIEYEGYVPSLPAPQIEMGDPPTFGTYDADKNILYIAIWSKLTAEERKFFEELAKSIGPKATARGVFEAGTNRWVFTHELSHWWQACQHQTRANSYEEEAGANRIASAYWRQRDPRFMEGMVEGFRVLRESIPNPVPPGESKIEFLDTHFSAVSITDGYTWYQSAVTALCRQGHSQSGAAHARKLFMQSQQGIGAELTGEHFSDAFRPRR